jgi:hypothetical protein
MALITQALLTADEAAAFINLQAADNEMVLEMLINGVSQKFCNFASRNFISTVYTSKVLDGPGGPQLVLPQWPVTLLSSVYENDTLLAVNEDFIADMDAGILTRGTFDEEIEATSFWTLTAGAITVTYTAGYTQAGTLPWDLKLAALMEVARVYQQFITKGYSDSSRSVEGASASVKDAAEDEWKKVVATYRRFRL